MRVERFRNRPAQRRRPAASALVLVALQAATGHAQELPDVPALVRRLQALEQQVTELRNGGARRAEPPRPTLPLNPISLATMAVKGSLDAHVVIVEFSDFQCPYCGAFARHTLPALLAKYIDTGRVSLRFANLPLAGLHPNALAAAETAECARLQGKFWQMHDALFADQRLLDQPALLARAKSVGLDLTSFEACIRTAGATVEQDLAHAKALGIAVTPTFVIGTLEADGTMRARELLVGAKDLAAFDAVLEPLLR